VGIDESTALLVSGDSATVYGINQVIVLNALNAKVGMADSLLKASNIEVDIYTKGDTFLLTGK